jgi:heptosyltransferase-3
MPSLQRYAGESLGTVPHIVVLGSCKVGNFVVSTPVLKGLKQKFPDSILGFIGSRVTEEFEQQHPCIDWRLGWDDPSDDAALSLQLQLQELKKQYGPIALAVNLDGFNPVTCCLTAWLKPKFVAGGSLSHDLRRRVPWGDQPQQRLLGDSDWDSPSFLSRYTDLLDSQYIAELFCHISYVADYVNPAAISLPQAKPGFVVPDVLIHCTTARQAKVWSFDSWRHVIHAIDERGWSVGLIGSTPSVQQQDYNAGSGEDELLSTTNLIDLRGQTTLIELAGACSEAKAVISVDAGPLHIAAAVGTPTLAVVGNDIDGVGASPIRLWLPRCHNVSRTVSTFSCSECSDNHFRNDACLVSGHPCMQSVDSQQVINWLYTLDC